MDIKSTGKKFSPIQPVTLRSISSAIYGREHFPGISFANIHSRCILGVSTGNILLYIRTFLLGHNSSFPKRSTGGEEASQCRPNFSEFARDEIPEEICSYLAKFSEGVS